MVERSFPHCCVIYTRLMTYFGLAVVMFSLVGCGAHYVTPGGGASLTNVIRLTDTDIQEVLNLKPVSPFPARLAVIRLQAPGYRSYRTESYGYGRYSVVTTRDIETDEHFEQLGRLPMISAVARINRILIPEKLESDKEMRMAAANLHADLLLMYTLDTKFRIKDHEIGPLGLMTLGFLPNQEARVTATASAVISDVRTGFVYGLAESTAYESEMATVWTSQDAVEDTRIRAETKAFEQLLDEISLTWKGIVEQYAASPAK